VSRSSPFFAMQVVTLLSCSVVGAAEPVLVRLTTDGALKQRPAWSPTADRVVFARHNGAAIRLFELTLATGREAPLTEQPGPEFDAVYSPDGTSLLYTFDKTSPNQGDMDIHRWSPAEKKSAPIAITGKTLSHEEWASWSPDGKRFAFTSTRDGNQEVYIADIAGGDWKRLTTDNGTDAHPAWSPDGNQIAFATDRWGDLEIAVIGVDGNGLERVTRSTGLDDYPAWSPDGKQLAFTSNRDRNLEIYVQDVGGTAVNLSRHVAIDNFPAWTADGKLGFISNRDDGFDLYVTSEPLSNRGEPGASAP